MRSLKKVSAKADMSEDDMLAQILGAQALSGLMEPDDVVELYLFPAECDKQRTGESAAVVIPRLDRHSLAVVQGWMHHQVMPAGFDAAPSRGSQPFDEVKAVTLFGTQ